MAHELPPLPYDHAALEPHIDAQTMQIHHGKHHQTYVTNLNNALQNHADLQGKSVEDLCKSINAQACHVWDFKDGKVTRFQQYVDTAQLQRAMGAP